MSKYYVATSIPYVNGAPHVGHALEAIVGDVVARYHRQNGDEVFYSYGTDEHGGKVAEKAEEQGISPKRYADQMSQSFIDLASTLDIEYTKFIRTTDKQHQQVAAVLWELMKKDIYSGQYVGMYDQKEETFIPKEEVETIKVNDPSRFETLQQLEETNYFFKLSKYTDKIKKLIESGELNIVPETRKHEILSVLNDGLDDISISRPKEKLAWGIPVPEDSSQVMYVWFEALMNYISTLDFPSGEDFKKFWPCDTHVIGKDILRFHAAMWPAMLLSLGLPLPKTIYVHGMVTMNGKTMSKSVGNVVAPMEIVSAYGSEAVRYYFLRHIPSINDGDFTWEKFERAYNGELGNDLGNLVQRVAGMINRYQDGVIGQVPEPNHDVEPYHGEMAEFRFDKALDYLWGLIRGLNQYIEEQKPWELAKDENEAQHLQTVLAYCVSSLLQYAYMMAPFLPKTSAKITEVFSSGVVKNYEGTLFPRINNHTV